MNKVQLTGNDKQDLKTLCNAINEIIDALSNKGADVSQHSGKAGDIKIQDYGNGKVRIAVKTNDGKYETGDLTFMNKGG